MERTINHDNTTECEPHSFSAFASDLGFEPGHWPTVLTTSLGNGQVFIRERAALRDGEFSGVEYRQELGCTTLIIFND
jgi:hypothetical protein